METLITWRLIPKVTVIISKAPKNSTQSSGTVELAKDELKIIRHFVLRCHKLSPFITTTVPFPV